MSTPLLSVIIPNHNYGRFLPRVFHSLKAQTLGLADTEIVFVDDGSTDNSLAMAEFWSRNLACRRFEVIAQERMGKPGAVRNIGFMEAQGRYLFALDPDDQLKPLFLESCLLALEGRPDVDLVYTDYYQVQGEAGNVVRLPAFDPDLLRTQNILIPPVMRREVWEQCEGWRTNTAYEDWDFWVQACLAGFGFMRLQTPLYLYERHGGGYSEQARKQDALSKAMIVLNNQAFFDPAVGRWASGRLRGEPWALPFHTGIIPRPQDVRTFLDIFVTASRNRRESLNLAASPHLRVLAAAG